MGENLKYICMWKELKYYQHWENLTVFISECEATCKIISSFFKFP